mgnify:CR=1 FL=1
MEKSLAKLLKTIIYVMDIRGYSNCYIKLVDSENYTTTCRNFNLETIPKIVKYIMDGDETYSIQVFDKLDQYLGALYIILEEDPYDLITDYSDNEDMNAISDQYTGDIDEAIIKGRKENADLEDIANFYEIDLEYLKKAINY